jgi:hypothetical protein
MNITKAHNKKRALFVEEGEIYNEDVNKPEIRTKTVHFNLAPTDDPIWTRNGDDSRTRKRTLH